MRADHVKWEWTAPDGDVWNLTTGDRGVKMSTDQAGLHWPDIKHVWSDNGVDKLGVEVGRLEPTLKLQVGVGVRGMEYYRCLNDWQRASSPHKLGTLRCTRPDGTSRQQKFYLRQSPGTTWRYDPGAGFEDNPDELWPLVSPDSWWESSEVTRWHVYGKDVPTHPAQRKEFFGDEGNGWPLYVTDGVVYVRNLGDAPLWPSWEFTGNRTRTRVGLIDPAADADDAIAYLPGMFSVNLDRAARRTSINPAKGYRLSVDTDPLRPKAILWNHEGLNPYFALEFVDAASFAPVMPGEKRRLHVDNSYLGLDNELDVHLVLRPRFALPF